MKILIIEDEVDIADPIRTLLKENRFEVDYAATGKDGLYLAMVNDYNCIILDINLPGVDGFDILHEIRREGKTTPILILSARSKMVDKMHGFTLGVDDYMTKPFAMQELLARVDALIRRSSVNTHLELTTAGLTLYVKKNIVESKNGSVSLTNKETVLLEYLMRNEGVYVSSEQLLEHVWASETNAFTDTVRTTIKTLRKKIDPHKELIKTIRGKGYMLVGPFHE